MYFGIAQLCSAYLLAVKVSLSISRAFRIKACVERFLTVSSFYLPTRQAGRGRCRCMCSCDTLWADTHSLLTTDRELTGLQWGIRRERCRRKEALTREVGGSKLMQQADSLCQVHCALICQIETVGSSSSKAVARLGSDFFSCPFRSLCPAAPTPPSPELFFTPERRK